MSYEAGARVRVKAGDPDHHTRVPRYVRGHTGVIVASAYTRASQSALNAGSPSSPTGTGPNPV